MASEIDICNLALSHFGQSASVSSINPPDGSAEAEHCQRFYPIARDELLEHHAWTFASKRATLAEVTNDRTDFAYKYALPADCLKPRRVLPAGYAEDEMNGAVFEWEDTSLYTNEASATLVYTFKFTNTARMSPKFVSALAWRLASYISGPITKDATGRIQGNLFQRSVVELGHAMTSNANADRNRAAHVSTAKAAR